MHILKNFGFLFIFSFILVSCSDDDSSIAVNASQQSNKQPLGKSANDLLSSNKYTSLHVEIVSVEGFEPTATAVTGLQQFLQDRLFKPDGITITSRSIPSSGKAPFSIKEIAEIENSVRTIFNEGDEIAVYIYFADGSNEEDSEDTITLGSAYYNTSLVIYEGTLRNLSNRPNSPSLSVIETTTLHHEFAHLMGLVNIGTPDLSGHEDHDAENHCNVSGCLMQAALTFGSGMMGIDEIPVLDPLCLADLRGNGGK